MFRIQSSERQNKDQLVLIKYECPNIPKIVKKLVINVTVQDNQILTIRIKIVHSYPTLWLVWFVKLTC